MLLLQSTAVGISCKKHPKMRGDQKMTIKEISEKFEISKSSLYDKFKRHKNKELVGHFTDEKGGNIELDDFAVNFLRPAKPQIEFLTKENAKLSDENNELREKSEEQRKKIEMLGYDKGFLEQFYDMDRKRFMEQIENLTGDARVNTDKISELTDRVSALEDELAAVTEERDSLKVTVEEQGKKLSELTAKKGLFRR